MENINKKQGINFNQQLSILTEEWKLAAYYNKKLISSTFNLSDNACEHFHRIIKKQMEKKVILKQKQEKSLLCKSIKSISNLLKFN